MMRSDTALYRPEAVSAAKERLGAPVNNFGVKNWTLVLFMTAAFVSVTVFISTARYTKKETVFGQVVPADGVARVISLKAGNVKSVLVKSGQTVVKDQPLFSVSYDPVLESGDALSGRMNQSTHEQIQFSQEQSQSKKQQIIQNQIETEAKRNGLKDDIAQLSRQKLLQIERIKLLQQNVDAAQSLMGRQYISAVQMRQRQDALLEAQQGLLQMEQHIEQFKSQIDQLTAQLSAGRQSLKEAEANMRLNKAELEERKLTNLSNQGGQIVALKSGQITSVQIKEGDPVAPNQTMALIVPNSSSAREQVTLWVPSRAIGFVQNGTKVKLMFDAFPYQTFGVGKGHVVEISTAPIAPADLPMPIETKEQMYRIVVAIDSDTMTAYGRKWGIIPGMRLSADLILDEKSLLDWLLDPLMAAKQRAAA